MMPRFRSDKQLDEYLNAIDDNLYGPIKYVDPSLLPPRRPRQPLAEVVERAKTDATAGKKNNPYQGFTLAHEDYERLYDEYRAEY